MNNEINISLSKSKKPSKSEKKYLSIELNELKQNNLKYSKMSKKARKNGDIVLSKKILQNIDYKSERILNARLNSATSFDFNGFQFELSNNKLKTVKNKERYVIKAFIRQLDKIIKNKNVKFSDKENLTMLAVKSLNSFDVGKKYKSDKIELYKSIINEGGGNYDELINDNVETEYKAIVSSYLNTVRIVLV